MLSSVYEYPSISNLNYNTDGHFHNVQREDSLLNVCVTNMAGSVLGTTVKLQVCIEDVDSELNWMTVSAGNVIALGANGSLMLSGISGFTGVRVVPSDALTDYVLSVVEYFPPDKIKTIDNDSFLVR